MIKTTADQAKMTSTYRVLKMLKTRLKSEICRFESVHPNIYAVYELLQLIDNSKLQNQIREHIINIEDSFVNSQEWTISRRVLELRLAVIGWCFYDKVNNLRLFLTRPRQEKKREIF